MATARNVVKALLLLLAFCGVLGGLGWIVGEYRLLSIFVFAALLLASAVWWYGDRTLLGSIGARDLVAGEAPALHSTVERLAARAQVVKPRLQVIADPFPRILSAGRGGRGSTIALSTGLIATASPAELEGLLAHEVAHLRHRDTLIQTIAAVLATTLVEISRLGGFLQRALLFLLGPIASAFVHLLLSPKREFEADRLAAELCGSPHGLADALVRLEQASELVEFRGSPATEPLYPVNPFAEEGLAALFATHPPTPERVSRLRALDPASAERARAA